MVKIYMTVQFSAMFTSGNYLFTNGIPSDQQLSVIQAGRLVKPNYFNMPLLTLKSHWAKDIGKLLACPRLYYLHHSKDSFGQLESFFVKFLTRNQSCKNILLFNLPYTVVRIFSTSKVCGHCHSHRHSVEYLSVSSYSSETTLTKPEAEVLVNETEMKQK